MCSKCDSSNHCHSSEEGNGRKWIYAGISAALLAVGIVLQYVCPAVFLAPYKELLFIIAYLPVGYPVIKEAFEGIKNHDFFNEFSLMVVASIGAFCIGEYPEAVAVMLFYSVGETLQDGAVDRARGNIKALLDVRPEVANVIVGDSIEKCIPKDVAPGSVIEVKTGERVPLDGVLLGDKTSFNTAALTGESLPRSIASGEEVLAGMIPDNKNVRIRTTRNFTDSALSRILQMVEDASTRKAPAELFIRKFAKIYTPIVVVLAVAIAVVLSLLSTLGIINISVYDSIYRGLVFLVVSCPCALVVSVPLSYFAGIGAASKKGILFKGGNYLSAIRKLTTVVFDKTGTLTDGSFEVRDVKTFSGEYTEVDILSVVSSVESHSTHPIAKAILEYCMKKSVNPVDVESVEEIAGCGLQTEIGGKSVLVGNMKLFAKENVANVPELSDDSVTIVGCSVGGVFVGALYLSDRVKSDAVYAISELKRQGIDDTMILSGDRSAIVKSLAGELGVKRFAGDLLPDDKVRLFENLKNEPGKVAAFVGDGINDAPVLALSDVGIAMGGLGSDAAIETADVVIQDDKPSKVAMAVKIGKVTERIVIQNIAFAISVKVAVLLLGVLGVASLWEAVFADVGVALLAVLNALRIQWIINR